MRINVAWNFKPIGVMTAFMLNLFRSVWVSILQVALAVISHDLVVNYFRESGRSMRTDTSWGVGLHYGFYLFAILVFIINMLWGLKMPGAYKLGILGFVIIVYSLFWITGWKWHPNRTLLVMVCTVAGFMSILVFRSGALRTTTSAEAV